MAAEPGYFFTQLVSAVHFLENADASSLSIDPELFEKSMSDQQLSTRAAPEGDRTSEIAGSSEPGSPRSRTRRSSSRRQSPDVSGRDPVKPSPEH